MRGERGGEGNEGGWGRGGEGNEKMDLPSCTREKETIQEEKPSLAI